MKIKRVDHVGIVLADVTPLRSLFIDVLGLRPGHEEVYQGAEGEENICFFPVGDTELELCSSLGPVGESARLVAERGQHIEHIAFEVKDIEEAVKELKSKGVPLLQEEPIHGARDSQVIFLDPRATNDILIEIVQPADSP